jgi:hypothetical protein
LGQQRLGIIRVWAFLSLESLLRASSAFGIIRVRALLSLESLLWASSALVLFECGHSCPLNCSFGSSAPVYYSSVGYLVPRISLSVQQHLGIIRVWAFLSLESLFQVFSTCILFECGISCPSNLSFGLASPWYYLSVGVLVPRIAPSGQQRLGIIRVPALLSLESLFRVFSTCILFECGLSCPSNLSFGPVAPWYYSSVGVIVPRIAPSGQQRLDIIRVRALLSLKVLSRSSAPSYYSSVDALSLESLRQAFRAFISFECGRFVPRITSSGLQRLPIIQVWVA